MIRMRAPMILSASRAMHPGPDLAHLANQRQAERAQQFLVERHLDRLGWQLHQDDGGLRQAETRIDDPGMVAAELLQDHGFAHARPAMDQQAGHAVALRVGQ